MSVRLILVCKEGPAKLAYLKEAKSIGIEVDSVASFGELSKAMISTPYQGIMLDLITSLKSSREEKSASQKILDVYPLVQLKWESESNAIHTISLGNPASGGSLAHFIAKECQPFKPRAIRVNPRRSINFNVAMYKQEDFNEDSVERTVTINASKGGCFLFSCRDWSAASEVWLVFNELTDKTPLCGEIRWYVQWGKTMTMPGIGISFKQIKTQQLDELIEKYSL
jgi:hypothetical protein